MNWNFDGISIAVIGDHNLDIDYIGSYPGLMSREHDSLAVFESKDSDVRYSGGGAANIVEMLADIETKMIIPVGVWNTWTCQRSKALSRLFRLFRKDRISTGYMTQGISTPAFIKFYRPSGVHIFRANIASEEMTTKIEDEVISDIEALQGKVDLVIVADYDETGKGVITDVVRAAIHQRLSCPKIGLSRTRCDKLRGYDYLILNETELKRAVYDKSGDIKQNVRDLCNKLLPENVIITLEGKGAVWYSQKIQSKSDIPRTLISMKLKETIVPSVSLTENIDTCGCGDAFVALFAACIARGDDIEQAIKAGNAAGRAQARMLCGARNITVEQIKSEWEELYQLTDTL